MRLTREMREKLKSSLHGFFILGQKFGWDILPRHFYSSIPSIDELEHREAWKLPSSMVGISGTDVETQMSFLRECCSPPLQERLRRGGIYEHACEENGAVGYGPIEAEFLFCYITTKRPSKIVQIGSGVSTAVILLAAQEAHYKPELICIDPFPTAYLTRMEQQQLLTLIPKPAEELDLSVLTNIGAGDLLFIDSTHTVRPGSEVNRIILEVLPRLPSGCGVHFHDIYFPYDYPSSLLTSLFFPTESTLLHAFLIGNQRYAIAVSLSMLHYARSQDLQLMLPNYRPADMQYGLHTKGGSGHFPSSTYLSVS